MLVVVRSVRILYRVTQGHLSLTCGSSLYFTCCPILLLCSFVFVADLHLYTEHLFFLLLAVLLCSVLSLLNEWVVTIGRNVSTFHLYHDENEQVTCRWDNDDISYILGQQAWLDFNSDITLNQSSSADRHVSTLRHIITIIGQQVFALSPYYWLLSGEAAITIFAVFGFTRPGISPKISLIQGDRDIHYAAEVVNIYWYLVYNLQICGIT